MENSIPVIRVIGPSATHRAPSITHRRASIQIRALPAAPGTLDDSASADAMPAFGGMIDVLQVRLVP